ncbi:hypothetical protein N8772_04320 [Rickettsiales bacterium]|nr:hypothetical protein [Rickettsiales bacterium]MDB2550425.1 hypothetical protein [Rickettsiales bacterium]
MSNKPPPTPILKPHPDPHLKLSPLDLGDPAVPLGTKDPSPYLTKAAAAKVSSEEETHPKR